jgi:hypothetical protein
MEDALRDLDLGLGQLSAGPVHGADTAEAAAARARTWTPSAVNQVTVYCTVAQLHASMNERAAGLYRRLDTAAMVLVSILTVVTGSQSVPLLTTGVHDSSAAPSSGSRGFSLFVALCGIALGAVASIVSRLDWRSKATVFSKRAVGYARLAASVRLQLALYPHQRDSARDTLERINTAIGHLEALGDPLPYSYRTDARVDQGVMAMWGASRSTMHLTLPPSRQAADVEVGIGVGAGGGPGPACTTAQQLRIRVPSTDLSPAAEGDARTHVAALAARLAPEEGDPAVVVAEPPLPPPPHAPLASGMTVADLCRAVRQEMGCTTDLPSRP